MIEKRFMNTDPFYLAKRDLRKVYKMARNGLNDERLESHDRAIWGRLMLDIAMAGLSTKGGLMNDVEV